MDGNSEQVRRRSRSLYSFTMVAADGLREHRTFCKWYVVLGTGARRGVPARRRRSHTRLNTKLESHGLEPMTSLAKDFSDGVKLIQVGSSCEPC